MSVIIRVSFRDLTDPLSSIESHIFSFYSPPLDAINTIHPFSDFSRSFSVTRIQIRELAIIYLKSELAEFGRVLGKN